MIGKSKRMAAIAAFLILTSCSDVVGDTVAYEITKDEVVQTSQTTSKRTVDVELSSRVDKEVLRKIGEDIYSLPKQQSNPTFISYFLNSERGGDALWATTHYKDGLNVELIGLDPVGFDVLKNAALPEGQVLGSWLNKTGGFEYRMTVYKKGSQTYIETYHVDGSKGDNPYSLTSTNTGYRLSDKRMDEEGEAYIVNKNGDLELWVRGELINTARRI